VPEALTRPWPKGPLAAEEALRDSRYLSYHLRE